MHIQITVSKAQLTNKPFVIAQVDPLCTDIAHQTDIINFSPRPGKLSQILVVLNFHKIKYAFSDMQGNPVPINSMN